MIFRDFIFSLGSLHDGCLVASSRLFSVFYKKCPRHNVSNRSKRRQQLSIDAAVWHDKNTQIHQLNDIVSPRVICRQKIKTIIIFREVEISLKLVHDMIRIVRMLLRWGDLLLKITNDYLRSKKLPLLLFLILKVSLGFIVKIGN